MQLKVGPYIYRVTMARGYLDLDGEPCLGLCDHERHLLEVSDRCSPAQRVQVIFHEYMEAWLYHFGHPGMDKEGYCDLFGLAMTQFVQDRLPDWCRSTPPVVPAGFPTTPDPSAPEYPAKPPRNQGVQASDRPPRVTGVRVTEHFMSGAEPMADRDTPSGTGPDGPAGGSIGWRVRVHEPLIEPD